VGQQCCAPPSVSTTKIGKTQTTTRDARHTLSIRNGLNIAG